MTNIERFQRLQVELVRAGFETDLRAKPDGDDAVIGLTVDLRKHAADDVEQLDVLTSRHGFSYTIGEDSYAGVVLAGAK